MIDLEAVMRVFDESFCVIETNETIVIQNWTGFANEDQFKTAINTSLELFQNGSFVAIVSDTKYAKAISPSLIEWLNTEINPKLVLNGLKKMAFVMPLSAVAKMGTDQFQSSSHSQNLETKYFISKPEALKWVSSKG